jgi:superfamily II DNA/RNA helicase
MIRQVNENVWVKYSVRVCEGRTFDETVDKVLMKLLNDISETERVLVFCRSKMKCDTYSQ